MDDVHMQMHLTVCMRVCFIVCGHISVMYACLLYGLWVQWWHVCVFASWSVATMVACMRIMVCGQNGGMYACLLYGLCAQWWQKQYLQNKVSIIPLFAILRIQVRIHLNFYKIWFR